MSTVRVVVVQVEGSVEDVVQVCEQLRLSLPAAAAMPQPAPIMHQAPQPMHREPAPMPRGEPARSLEQVEPPAPAVVGGMPDLKPGSVLAQRSAAADDADGVRDVIVPRHPTMTRRPRHQLFEDLAAVIPAVGDTVRVAEFIRDEAEKQILKTGIDKYDGDKRFKWLRGMPGGARPARIKRERL